jgi:RNA polymerase sigma-70 factor (ECF subfamily)
VDVAVLTRRPAEATDEALEAVFRRRHPEFLRVATAITGSVELGEDAVQEGLVRALSRRSTFRGTGALEAWLWKVIVNAARNVASRTPRPSDRTMDETEATTAGDEAAAIRGCLALLPERQRLALFLRYYADLDYATIARALGVRRGTISATLNQAHAALRPLLAEEVDR